MIFNLFYKIIDGRLYGLYAYFEETIYRLLK